MICHLTHRRHDHSFLFNFARDRSAQCEALRRASAEFRVSLLNFCVTSNHMHQLAIENRKLSRERVQTQVRVTRREKRWTASIQAKITVRSDGHDLFVPLEYT
jgi:hypothetical protein